MTAADFGLPPAHSFAWTVVSALRELGGSGSIEEINEKCVQLRGLTEEQQAVQEKRGNRSEVEYRLAWARTLAKALGLIVNSERGVWALTERGLNVDEAEVEDLKRMRSRDRAKAKRQAKVEAAESGADAESSSDELEEADEPEQDWKVTLLNALKGMEPAAFERSSG